MTLSDTRETPRRLFHTRSMHFYKKPTRGFPASAVVVILLVLLGRAEGQSTAPSFQRHCNAGYYVSGSKKNYGQAYTDNQWCSNWVSSNSYQTGFGSQQASHDSQYTCLAGCIDNQVDPPATYSFVVSDYDWSTQSYYRMCRCATAETCTVSGGLTEYKRLTSIQASCSPCNAGTYQGTNSYAGSSCTPKTVTSCAAGQGFSDGGTTAENSCTACGTGFFQPNDGSTNVCTAWTHSSCSAGQFYTAGNTTTDSTCTPCANNEYSSGGTATECTAKTVFSCPTGQGLTDGGNSTDNSCAACAAGTANLGVNADACEACAVGTFSASGASQCTPWVTKTCGAGQQHTDEGREADASCQPCPTGTYKQGTNADQCSVCPAGSEVTPVDSSSGATGCQLCTRASHWDSSGTSVVGCETVSFCAAGESMIITSPDQNNLCHACAAGTYQGVENSTATSCQACPSDTFSLAGADSCTDHKTECPAGFQLSALVDSIKSTHDRHCEVCPAGMFKASSGSASCAAHATPSCPAGEEARGSSTADATCQACPAGMFKASAGTDMCAAHKAPCDAILQTESTAPSATEDRVCANKYVYADATSCCAEWQDANGDCQLYKTECGPGHALQDDGGVASDKTCQACASGHFKAGTNADACTGHRTTCPEGTELNQNGDSTKDHACDACQAGDFKAGDNANQCATCGAGTWTSDNIQCVAHTVCDATTEIQLAAGTTSSDTLCGCAADHHSDNGTCTSCNSVVVSTIAGTGSSGSADGIGTAASFNYPQGVASIGTDLYVTDKSNNLIRKIDTTTNAVTTIAGSGSTGSSDGTGTAASFNAPHGIAAIGNDLYVNDYANNLVRKIDTTTNAVTTIAGSGSQGSTDGTGTAASFNYPYGITSVGTDLYVADSGSHLIRKIDTTTNAVTTIAGSGSTGSSDGIGTAASFNRPVRITSVGTDLYVADLNNHLIRKIDTATGAVTTVAGTGSAGSSDGIGTAASFNKPNGLTSVGTKLYVSESSGHSIREIDTTINAVITIAGSGSFGSSDGIGTAASFKSPRDLTVIGSNLYVADTNNHIIRKLEFGTATRLAGDSKLSSSACCSGGYQNAATEVCTPYSEDAASCNAQRKPFVDGDEDTDASCGAACAVDGWAERYTGTGAKVWVDSTSSADGTKLAAVELGGNIWTSDDSGASLTEIDYAGWDKTQDWKGITSSADGTKLAAVVSGGNIWTSDDSGATWTEVTSTGAGKNWYAITSSADGTRLAAVVLDGNIWTSNDSGSTWTEVDYSGWDRIRGWRDIISSADGTRLAAVVYGGNIWTSANSGASWTERTVGDGTNSWFAITSSADGTELAAVVRNGNIWTSDDSGATWTEVTSTGAGKNWYAITSSADGTKLAAVVSGGNIWTSDNSGATWTEDTSVGATKYWRAITSSADGTKLVAVVSSGNVWTKADITQYASGASCVAYKTTCPAGQQLSTTLTPAADLECLACPQGTYKEASGGEACAVCAQGNEIIPLDATEGGTGCSPCDKTQEFDADGSHTACVATEAHCDKGFYFHETAVEQPNTCTPCDSGTYQPLDDTTNACVAWTVCLGTEIEAISPTSSRDRVCACAADHHLDGNGVCQACGAGETRLAGDAKDEAATSCCANSYQLAAKGACQAATDCDATSELVKTALTASSDRVCECAENYRYDGSGACQACTGSDTRLAGDAKVGASKACCSAGFQASAGGSCTPWITTCQDNYELTGGTASAQKTCVACASTKQSTGGAACKTFAERHYSSSKPTTKAGIETALSNSKANYRTSSVKNTRMDFRSMIKFMKTEIAALTGRRVKLNKSKMVMTSKFSASLGSRTEVEVVVPKSKTKLDQADACTEKDIDLSSQTDAYDVSLEEGEVSLICTGSTPMTKLRFEQDSNLHTGVTDDTYKYSCWTGSAWDTEVSVTVGDDYQCGSNTYYVNSHSGVTCTATAPVSSLDSAVVAGTNNCGTVGEGHACTDYACNANFVLQTAPNCTSAGYTPAVCHCPANFYEDGAGQCLPHSTEAQLGCNAQRKKYVLGTATADASCGATCSASEYASGEVCVPYSTDEATCAAARKTYQAGTENVDASCLALCLESQYVSGNQCLDLLTQCADGKELTGGSNTTNRVCIACASGEYKVGTNADSCQACSAGFEIIPIGATSEGTGCEVCTVAHEYDHDNNAVTGCLTTNSTCDNSYQILITSGTQPNLCVPCASGTFQPDDATTNQCQAHTVVDCGDGEELTTAPNAMRDGVCTPCAGGKYKIGTNTDVCVEHSNCPIGEGKTANGTASTNTQCAACSGWASSDWQLVTSGNNANSVDEDGCKAYRAQLQPVPSYYGSDYQGGYSNGGFPDGCFVHTSGVYYNAGGGQPCSAGAQCVQPSASTFSDTDDKSACQAHATCAVGEGLLVAGNSTHNTVCAPCGAGTFSSVDDKSTCQAHANCPVGEGKTVDGTASANTQCAACGAGFYSDANDNSACQAHSNCPLGEGKTLDGTASANTQCAACGAGFYSSVDDKSACQAHGNCPIGEGKTLDGTASANTQCAACGAGFYSDANDKSACQAHSNCPVGEGKTVDGTASANTQCAACGAGFYSDTNDKSACQAYSTCPAGKGQTSAGNATSDTVCSDCAAEFYSSTDDNSACQTCNACVAGQVETTACSSLQNRVCAAGQCTSMPAFANEANADGQGTCTGTLTHGQTCQLSCDAGHHPATYTCDTETLNAPATACMVCEAYEHSDGDSHCATDAAYTTCQCTNTTCTEAVSIDKYFVLGNSDNDDSQCLDATIKQASDCPDGSEFTSANTGTANGVCTPCGANEFSTGGAACQAHTPCGNQLDTSPRLSGATATTAGVCDACANGTYAATGAETCAAHSDCPVGQGKTADGTASANTQCTACSGWASSDWQLVTSGNNANSVDEDGCKAYRAQLQPVPSYYGSDYQGGYSNGGFPDGCFVHTSGVYYNAGGGQPCSAGAQCVQPSASTFSDTNDKSACQAHATCAVGEGKTLDGTASANTQCAACGAGFYSDANDKSACQAHSNCPVGEGKTVDGTASANTQCATCGAGTFSSVDDKSACQAHATCPVGQGKTADGTASANTQCAACGNDLYSSVDDKSACQTCTACVAGQVETTACTSSQNRVCAAGQCTSMPAFANEANADGQGTCTGTLTHGQTCQLSCDAGHHPATYTCDTETLNAPATACMVCEAYEHSDGDSHCATDAAYTTCQCSSAACTEAVAIDKYFVVGNSDNDDSQCLVATIKQASDCPDGSEFTSANTGTANGVCTPCGANEYSTNGATCQAHTSCGNQLDTSPRLSGATATTAGVCDACANGTYAATAAETCTPCGADQFSSGGAACQAHSTCPVGEGKTLDGTASTDTQCAACGAGFFSSVDDKSACQAHSPCAAGKGVLTAGTSTTDTACEDCVDGTSYSETASTTETCQACAGTCLEEEAIACTASQNRVCGTLQACTMPAHTSKSNTDSAGDCLAQLASSTSCSFSCTGGYSAATYSCYNGTLTEPAEACLACQLYEHSDGDAATCATDAAYTTCGCNSAACPEATGSQKYFVAGNSNADDSQCLDLTITQASDCADGSEFTAPTGTSNGVCTPCAAGSFSTGGAACQVHATQCPNPQTEYISQAGSLVADIQCSALLVCGATQLETAAPSTNAAGAFVTNRQCGCLATEEISGDKCLCKADHYVSGGECKNCSVGYSRAAGDEKTGGDTTCSESPCTSFPAQASVAFTTAVGSCSGSLAHGDSCSYNCAAGFQAQSYSCDKGVLTAPEIACLCPAQQHESAGACVDDTAYTNCGCQTTACPESPANKFFSIGMQDNLDSSECRLPSFTEEKLGTAARPTTETAIAAVIDNFKPSYIDAASNSAASAATKKEQFKSVITYSRREIAKLPQRRVAIDKASMVVSQEFLDSVPAGKKVDIVIPKQKTPATLANLATACTEKDIQLSGQDNAYDVALEEGDTSLICHGTTAKTKLKRDANGYKYSCVDGNAWTAETSISEDSSYTCPEGGKYFVNSHSGTTCAVEPPVSQSFPSITAGTSGTDCGTHIGENATCSYECNSNFLKVSGPACSSAGVFTRAVCSCVHDGFVDNAMGSCQGCTSGTFSTGGQACQPWTVTEASCNTQNKVFVAGTHSTDSSCGITCAGGLIADGALCKEPSTAVSCASLEWMYFSDTCCDGVDRAISCMASLTEQKIKIVDSLATLKQDSGADCTDGMEVSFKAGKIVCK